MHALPFFDPIDGADAGFDSRDHIGAPAVPALARTGGDSPSAGMVLTLDAMFSEGATEELLTKLYQPWPGLPLTTFQLRDRSRTLVPPHRAGYETSAGRARSG